jgi:hypothetical protein
MRNVAAFFIASFLCNLSFAQVAIAPEDFYGTWTITRMNSSSIITTLDDDSEALVHSTLVISATRIDLADELACHVSKYKIVVVDAEKEVHPNTAPSPAAAGLPDRVARLSGGCEDFYMVDATLVFSARGTWYSAERVGRL